MAWLKQNNAHTFDRPPSYYTGNRSYGTGVYAKTEWQGRTSRRIHDGFTLSKNYGLDTVSDDLNSSPYSSPYYINGRYNSDALTMQRGNSASVQGIKRLNDIHSVEEDFTEADKQTSIGMWQGKQIKFEIPYHGKVVGNTISIKNTDGCTGILSMYFSTTDGGKPIYETAIDLCKVSVDKFEHFKLYGSTPIPQKANPKGKLYVRMEIWDEVDMERSRNPFNTGRKIEIAATGKGIHFSCVNQLGEKNIPVRETFEYRSFANRPLVGLIYNSYESVPTDRIDQEKNGATVSLNGYQYDIFCCKDGTHAEVLVYDRAMNKFIDNQIQVDGRVTQLNVAQCTDVDRNTWVYYVDGHSPLQRFKIGEWVSQAYPVAPTEDITVSVNEATWWASSLGQQSGYYEFRYRNGNWLYDGSAVTLSDYGISLSDVPANEARIYISTTVTGGTHTLESAEYVDVRPVVGASLIMFHNNRLYLSGFEKDRNLLQVSEIDENGPVFDSFPYRVYIPNRSPYDTTLNPIIGMVEYATDQIMVLGKNFYSIWSTYGSGSKSTGLEDYAPTQVSTYVDSAGIASQGDVCNYKGIIYSFDQKEGLRRFSGGVWHVIPNSIDSHYDRVDMTKPRKIWGYANKLYYNYIDRIDGKSKCIVWDQQMNYQSYPFFQDSDVPFCDIRYDEKQDLIGIHPDYPCVMEHYAEDVWARLDTPIVFERHTKFLSVPGGNHDMIVKHADAKIIANSNRWVWIGLNFDKHYLEQHRGKDVTFRFPTWDTVDDEEPVEMPFATEDIYEENALSRLTIQNLNIRCTSIQMRIRCKTFREQFNLVSTGFQIKPIPYL